MTLITYRAHPGDWIVIEDAAPDDLSRVSVVVGGFRGYGFIDGKDVRVRCPQFERGLYEVIVSGKLVGKVMVRS